MTALFRSVYSFITSMDKKAARAIGVSLGLFVLVGAVFVIGRVFLNLDPQVVDGWFETAATQWYALPLTILVFTLLSFFGAPQFMLMAAAIAAFGPRAGFVYAWIATLSAATINYVLGRLFGADLLKRYGGDFANRISDFIGRNGVLASMIVRWVPSGPFIVVNMSFGVARTPYWAFILGAALGTAPKIFIVALAGQSILAVLAEQNILLGLSLVLAVAAWIGVMLLARHWLRRPREEKPESAEDSETREL